MNSTASTLPDGVSPRDAAATSAQMPPPPPGQERSGETVPAEPEAQEALPLWTWFVPNPSSPLPRTIDAELGAESGKMAP